jgi:hypothetical protein
MALRRFWDDSSDDLVSLSEFHGLSGMEPGLKLPGVAKLADIHLGHISSWHEMCHIVKVGEKQMSRVAGAKFPTRNEAWRGGGGVLFRGGIRGWHGWSRFGWIRVKPQ